MTPSERQPQTFASQEQVQQLDSELAKPYRGPQISDGVPVESITHGSRQNTSDEPDSGHRGD